MEKKKAVIALVLLMIAAFLIGFGVSQCGYDPGTPTEPPQTTAPEALRSPSEPSAEVTVPDTTVPSAEATVPETTVPPIDTAPPETAPASPTKPPKETEPPQPTEPPETAPPPQPTEPTVPPETSPPETTSPPAAQSDVTDTPSPLALDILEQINQSRQENGLPALATDPRLCELAYIRAHELNQYNRHIRPDGRECISILTDNGYPFASADDTLIVVTPDFTGDIIVSSWLSDPESRERLLDPAFEVFGAAVYESGGVCSIAVFFADPL